MYQKHVIVGHVGKDPDSNYTPDGVMVTNFTVACSRRYPGKDGQMREETRWFRVTAWRQLAEQAGKYVHKGMQVLVEGEDIKPNAYVDREGKPQATMELTARVIRFLGKKEEGANGQPSMIGGAGGPEPFSEDDLPF